MIDSNVILSLILLLIKIQCNYGWIKPVDYLLKYGYMEPTHRTAGDFREALKTFQMLYRLPVTGEFDVKTRQLMASPRCGNSDPVSQIKYRIKNRIQDKGYILRGSKWTNYKLTFWVRPLSTKLDEKKTLSEIKESFKVWSDVTPLRFIETELGKGKKVHFEVGFATRLHCCHPGGIPDMAKFDGPGGDLAHAAWPSNGGDIHFDDDDHFELDNSSKNTSIPKLRYVAIHEFGHALGLEHTLDLGSIMYPYENGWKDAVLDQGSIAGIRVLYGNESIKLP